MSDLITFLRARLDEDAAEMNALADEFGVGKIIRSRSRRIIDIDAKRRIIDEIVPEVSGMADQIYAEFALPGEPLDDISDKLLRLLALPYVDHPDYREEWRP